MRKGVPENVGADYSRVFVRTAAGCIGYVEGGRSYKQGEGQTQSNLLDLGPICGLSPWLDCVTLQTKCYPRFAAKTIAIFRHRNRL